MRSNRKPGSFSIGVKQVREPVGRDHHGVVPGLDLDHLPPNRLDPICFQRLADRIRADDVAGRQAVADLIRNGVLKGCGVNLVATNCFCAASVTPNATGGGAGMLKPPLVSWEPWCVPRRHP
jgi:hypothetical protein